MKQLKKNLGFMIFITSFQLSSLGQNQEIIEKISYEITMQQQAWNNGDIDRFMSFYWDSDSLIFVSKKGITKGYKEISNNYKQSYPYKDKMGILNFDNFAFKIIDKSNVIVLGSWKLSYTNSNVGGYFTLWWKKINGNWKIILDHTS